MVGEREGNILPQETGTRRSIDQTHYPVLQCVTNSMSSYLSKQAAGAIKFLQAMNYSGKKVLANVRNSYYVTLSLNKIILRKCFFV